VTGSWLPRRARRFPRRLAAALAGVALLAHAAPALQIGFDDLAPGSDVAAADLGPVHVGPALVLDEAALGLLGFAAAGTWATSGDTGIFNTLAAVVTFDFAAPVRAVAIDVLALADGAGAPFPVVLRAFRGGLPVAEVVSDPGVLGDSGFPEATLALDDAEGFQSLALFTAVACGEACWAAGPTSSFFADTLRFQTVPEAGAGALLLAAGATLGAVRMRGGRIR